MAVPIAGRIGHYELHEKRPAHPVTGVLSAYFWERPDGVREPRWAGEAYPKAADPAKCWYSVPEVAQLLGRCEATVRMWLRAGKLRGHRPRTLGDKARWFISGADVETFVRGQTDVAPIPIRVVPPGALEANHAAKGTR